MRWGLRSLGIEPVKIEPSEVDRLIEAAKRAILESVECCGLYLFGSAATGNMTYESDLDFVILVDNPSSVDSVRRKLGAVPRPANIPLDIIVLTREEFERKSQLGGVCMVAMNEGRDLMELKNG